MTKEIPLTNGGFALVDDDKYDFLTRWSWSNHHGYAERRTKNINIGMHRLILSAKSGEEVDHINGNRLDNRVANLRICTTEQNARNRQTRSDNKTGCKGVTYIPTENKWKARITVGKKRITLGRFSNLVDAANAYAEAAKKYFGDFFRLA